MSDLPHQATITTHPVSDFSHLKEPFRSKWIRCITCKQVPTETVYMVHIPQLTQGDKRSFAVGTVCCSEKCADEWLAKYTPHFHTLEEMEGSTLLPTQEQKPGWIHCFRKTGMYPDPTRHSGKWLIWLSPETIDRFWTRIKQAVEEGRLGDEAKVSTAGSLNKKGMYVICVYTYDYQDKDDVIRIREELRALGIRREIIYKANEDTRALRYGSDYTPKYRA
jgi:hypothetical protein